MDQPLLSTQNLKTYFFLMAGMLKAVDGVSLDIDYEKSIGIGLGPIVWSDDQNGPNGVEPLQECP